MRNALTILLALLLAIAPTAQAQSNSYGWTISSNGTDPFVNTGAVTGAPLTLFLWLYCSNGPSTPQGIGMSAAEFDLQLPPGVLNFGFTPMNGFLNAGGASNLLLAVGGCPTGPVAAGSWTVFNTAAGSYCLVPSAANGILGVVDCDTKSPQIWPVGQKGFGAGGAATCDEELCVTAVEATSWGTVKSLYR